MDTPYKVTSVLSEKSGQPPVIVEFENGKINPALAEPLKCKLYKDVFEPQRKYVTVENGSVTYIGCPDSVNNPLHTYLAIRNRETHKVQLIRVESVRATAAVGREFQPSKKNSDTKNEHALLDLSRHFGSKNAKRVQEQKLRFRQISKSDAHLKDVVQDKVISTDELQGTSEDSLQTLLPPCNTKTSLPNEVYDLNDIINEEELKSLREGFEAKETEEEEAFIKICSPLFNSLLSKCMKNAKNMALLLYAEYLVRLCNKKRTRSLFEICDCSEDIAIKMCTEFLIKKGSERVLTSATLDKVVLRIVIIVLHLSEFNLDILPLANSLRFVNTARIRLLVRVTGAIFPSQTSSVARLRAPITPFKMNAAPFSKKRKR